MIILRLQHTSAYALRYKVQSFPYADFSFNNRHTRREGGLELRRTERGLVQSILTPRDFSHPHPQILTVDRLKVSIIRKQEGTPTAMYFIVFKP